MPQPPDVLLIVEKGAPYRDGEPLPLSGEKLLSDRGYFLGAPGRICGPTSPSPPPSFPAGMPSSGTWTRSTFLPTSLATDMAPG